MPLSTQLPQDYHRLLLLVIEGEMAYSEFSNRVFENLNPARVASISQQMSAALWSPIPRLGENWWSKGIAAFKSSLIELPEMAAVFSVSKNGYVREVAVRKWGRINIPFELALLILRLNDWVKPVRRVAVEKFEELMALPEEESGLTAETVIGCMDLILNSERFGRMGEAETGILFQLMNRNDMPAKLAAQIINSAVDSAPRYLKLALKRGLLRQELAIMAGQGAHPDVRRIALDWLLFGGYARNPAGEIQRVPLADIEGLPPINRAEIARTALSDRSAAVRGIALSYIAEFKPDDLYNEEIFRRFVMDKRFPIVERAIFGLRTMDIDYVEELRGNIIGGDVSIRALEVLGRFGNAADGALIFAQLDCLVKAHKIKGLGAAARLGHAASRQALGALLFETEDVDEARTVSSKLNITDYTPEIEDVIKGIQTGQDLQARGAMRLIRRLRTMELALAISELMTAGIEFDEASFWQLLSKKRNTGYFSPLESELSALRARVEGSDVLRAKFERVLGVRF